MEVFESPEGYYFSECAARSGGGGIIEVFEAKFGLNLVRENAKAVMGLAPDSPVVSERSFGCTLLRAPIGRVVQAPDLAQLTARPGVVHGNIYSTIGRDTPDMSTNTVICAGSAIVAGDDEIEVVERIRAVREWFCHSVSVG